VASEDNQQARAGSVGSTVALSSKERRGSTAAILPDGSEFALGEQRLTFTKTCYVNNGAPAADDAGPGDRGRPFRTIGKTAEVFQPGERVRDQSEMPDP
jgi:hypothetical protein